MHTSIAFCVPLAVSILYNADIATTSISFCTVSYAAIDAILNKSAESLDGCTIYMTKCPRTEEAKLIIQVGIKEVIYFHKAPSDDCKWAKQLLYYANVRPAW